MNMENQSFPDFVIRDEFMRRNMTKQTDIYLLYDTLLFYDSNV